MSKNNEKIKELLNNIENKSFKVKLETVPIYEKLFTIDGLPMRKYDLLAIALKIAKTDHKEAKKLIRFTELIYDKHSDSTFKEISDALYAFMFYKEMVKNEKYYQEIFKLNVSKILGNEYLNYDRTDLLRKRPDAWVKSGETIIPVEMKKHDFNEKALLQLQKYMKLYSCHYGIAVARRLMVDIPHNIRFIDLSEVIKYDIN